jgi:hypothetical protein
MNVQDSWEVPKNDLGLLMAIVDKGISYLKTAKHEGHEYNLSGFNKMNKKKMLRRAEWVCKIYKEFFVAQRPTRPPIIQGSYDD